MPMQESEVYLEVCAITDVTPDLPAKGMIDGEEVAIFKLDDEYFITQDMCTHGPGSLSEGYVDGEEIECPFHQGKFDIRTGVPTAAPCTVALKTWPASVRGGHVCVMRQG